MIFLDGSLGHVLIARSKKKSAGTWSAQFLLKDSLLISEIYDEYIEAGSDIITTNTYSTIPSYLSKAGLESEMPTLIRRAGELAKNSALKYEGKIKIAGSIPPLDESYRPDLVHNLEQSLEVYEVLIKELNPFVDIYLCETISSVEETKNVVDQKVAAKAYVWTIFLRAPNRLRSSFPGPKTPNSSIFCVGFDVFAFFDFFCLSRFFQKLTKKKL